MKVRAIVDHKNIYGDKYDKEVGDIYELPDALGTTLIGSGIVEGADPLDHDGDGKKGGSRKASDEQA